MDKYTVTQIDEYYGTLLETLGAHTQVTGTGILVNETELKSNFEKILPYAILNFSDRFIDSLTPEDLLIVCKSTDRALPSHESQKRKFLKEFRDDRLVLRKQKEEAELWKKEADDMKNQMKEFREQMEQMREVVKKTQEAQQRTLSPAKPKDGTDISVVQLDSNPELSRLKNFFGNRLQQNEEDARRTLNFEANSKDDDPENLKLRNASLERKLKELEEKVASNDSEISFNIEQKKETNRNETRQKIKKIQSAVYPDRFRSETPQLHIHQVLSKKFNTMIEETPSTPDRGRPHHEEKIYNTPSGYRRSPKAYKELSFDPATDDPQYFIYNIYNALGRQKCSNSDFLMQVIPSVMKGAASDWWRQKALYCSTMNDFFRLFEERFIGPLDYRNLQEDLFARQQHNHERLTDYIAVIERMATDVKNPVDERLVVDTVIRGCSSVYRLMLLPMDIRSVIQLREVAWKIEQFGTMDAVHHRKRLQRHRYTKPLNDPGELQARDLLEAGRISNFKEYFRHHSQSGNKQFWHNKKNENEQSGQATVNYRCAPPPVTYSNNSQGANRGNFRGISGRSRGNFRGSNGNFRGNPGGFRGNFRGNFRGRGNQNFTSTNNSQKEVHAAAANQHNRGAKRGGKNNNRGKKPQVTAGAAETIAEIPRNAGNNAEEGTNATSENLEDTWEDDFEDENFYGDGDYYYYGSSDGYYDGYDDYDWYGENDQNQGNEDGH